MPPSSPWTGHEVDVAVVGAGSAGIAAARRLLALRPTLSVVVLEAGERLGGRAHTVTPWPDVPVDLGCGWLHGARANAWMRLAREVGHAVDRTPAPWNGGGRDLDGSADGSDEAAARFFDRAGRLSDDGPDRPLDAFLEPGNRWNATIGAVATYINGVELDRASARDYGRYDPGPAPDWRVRDGYGRLVATVGGTVPCVAGAAVSLVDHDGADRLRLRTARGTLQARAAVVTVSTSVLAAEAIRFHPPLPDKLQAAADLPLGHVEKLFVAVATPEDLPVDGHCLGSTARVATGAYQLRPLGRPVIECFFGGSLARDLGREGPAAAFAFAVEELAGRFGADFAARLAPGPMSAWGGTPAFGGAYSYARPGRSDQRAALAAPVGNRLVFAGEACSRHRYSTAHGAYETGVAAADALLGQAALAPA